MENYFAGNTYILMEDFSTKKISNLIEGDRIMGEDYKGKEIKKVWKGVCDTFILGDPEETKIVQINEKNQICLTDAENFFLFPSEEFKKLPIGIRSQFHMYKSLPNFSDKIDICSKIDSYHLGERLCNKDLSITRRASDSCLLNGNTKEEEILAEILIDPSRLIFFPINFRADILSAIIDNIGYYRKQKYMLILDSNLFMILDELCWGMDIKINKLKEYMHSTRIGLEKMIKLTINEEHVNFLRFRKLPSLINNNITQKIIQKKSFFIKKGSSKKCYGVEIDEENKKILLEDFTVVNC